MAALGTILQLAVPEAFEDGGTQIVPGRGRISEETDVAEFRDMVVIVKDRVQDLIKKGNTLDQIKAARPSRDYDAEYGATRGGCGPVRGVDLPEPDAEAGGRS